MTDSIVDLMTGWHAGATLFGLCVLILFAGECLLLKFFNAHMASGKYPAPRGPHSRKKIWLPRARRYGRAWFAEKEHWIVGTGVVVITLWGLFFSAASGESLDFGRSGSLVTILGLMTAIVGTWHAKGLFEAHFAVDSQEAILTKLEHNERAAGLSQVWVAVIVFLGTLIWGYGDLAFDHIINPLVCPEKQKLKGLRCYKPPEPTPPPAPIEQKKFVVFFEWKRFDWYKSKLRLAAEMTLQEAADYAKKSPKTKIHVIGHADSSGSAGYNMEIAAHRANTVKDALSKLIPNKRVTTSFEGAAEPLVATGKGVDEAKNRRVEIVISE